MSTSIRLSKSKYMAGRQCEKRLWLEVHRPDLIEWDDSQAARLSQGTAFGELARELLGQGVLVDCGPDMPAAIAQTSDLIQKSKPPRHVFEATLSHQNVLVRVDALRRKGASFEIIEVKSAGSVKEQYLDDCAVQTWVARGAGIDARRTWVAVADTQFVYTEEGNYTGLLRLEDVSAEVEERQAEVPRYVRRFRKVLRTDEPDIRTGAHCTKPYECPFLSYCQAQEEPGTEFPLELWCGSPKLMERLAEAGYSDLRDVPLEEVPKDKHRRMLTAIRKGKAVVTPELRRLLAALPYPRRYLDFEAMNFAVPRWLGTRPFEHIPFQWSCHVEKAAGLVVARGFLDTGGDDPRRELANSLIKTCGKRGPVLVYGDYESKCLAALSRHLPDLAEALDGIRQRLLDLLPLMRDHYYHPSMGKSWSLKSVLPTVIPSLGYGDLGDVADGMAAQDAYLEAIDPATKPSRRAELKTALKRYCERDTLGLVELVRVLAKH
jgi:hypothetical protein